jgi:hypothetical protein
MKMRKASRAVTAVALLSCWSATTLGASCVLSDLAGTWIGYAFNSGGFWTRCNVKVDTVGKIVQGSSCVGQDGLSAPISGSWSLISAANCTVKGFYTGGGLRSNITHATVSIDRNSIAGVGKASTTTFVFNANRL